MTIAEVNRYIQAKVRKDKRDRQNTAQFVYTLPLLINSSIMGKKDDYPKIYDVFPSLFDAEKMQEEDERSFAKAWKERFTELYSHVHKSTTFQEKSN